MRAKWEGGTLSSPRLTSPESASPRRRSLHAPNLASSSLVVSRWEWVVVGVVSRWEWVAMGVGGDGGVDFVRAMVANSRGKGEMREKASKAAILRLFETLQVELAPDVNVTIVVPGIVNFEMSQGRQLSQDNEMEIRETTRDFLQQSGFKYLMEGADEFVESIVNGICRGKNKLGQPLWIRPRYFALSICPELVQWILQRLILPHVSKNQGC
ncbi:hypothetical protein Droror1_Dr00012551 [Drosera rotundifolia]